MLLDLCRTSLCHGAHRNHQIRRVNKWHSSSVYNLSVSSGLDAFWWPFAYFTIIFTLLFWEGCPSTIILDLLVSSFPILFFSKPDHPTKALVAVYYSVGMLICGRFSVQTKRSTKCIVWSYPHWDLLPPLMGDCNAATICLVVLV